MSKSARNTISGTIKIRVKVEVDAAGNVERATFITEGPSKYFARQAMEAAQQVEICARSSEWSSCSERLDFALRLQAIRDRNRFRAGKALGTEATWSAQKTFRRPSQPRRSQGCFQYVRRHLCQEHPRGSLASPSSGNWREDLRLVLDHSSLLLRRKQQHAVTFRHE